jgi:DNA-directed RNA polymerase specialized sigma24 family protein
MLEAAAHELFLAARTGDPARIRAAVATLSPLLDPPVRAAVRRHQGLLLLGRVDEDDVLQRVFEKLLTHPPDNLAGRPPEAVILAWARSVAVRHLVDLSRRAEAGLLPDPRPAPDGSEAGDAGEEADIPVAPLQEATAERRLRLRLARRCADEDLARHKHLRELFYALAEDPDQSARELAVAIGLVTPDQDGATLQRAEQYVFKLRERVHTRIAQYLELVDRPRLTPRRHPAGGRR